MLEAVGQGSEAAGSSATELPTRTLSEVLAGFEARTTPLDARAVSYPLWELKRTIEDAGGTMPVDLHAEWLAFAVQAEGRDEGGDGESKWGTYYGPVGGFPGPGGTFIDVPSIDEVTPEIVAFWERRAREARHPVLRARYADVAWDLGRHRTLKVSPNMPRITIDATIACANRHLFEHCTEAFAQLRRALSLALSIKDVARATAVAEAMIAYEDRTAEDHLAGTWGFAFDALVENRPRTLTLPAATADKIVADMEARLARLAVPPADLSGATIPNAWGAERAALPLAQHYRRIGRPDDVRRVLLLYGQTFLAAVGKTQATTAMMWSQRVFEVYRSFGLSNDAAAIAVRIEDLGPEIIKELKPISGSTEVPTEDVQRFLSDMTAGTLPEVLNRIVMNFLTSKTQLTEQVKRVAQQAPISFMIGVQMMDGGGRPIARIGSVDDDLDGRVVEQTARNLAFEAPWLRGVIERMQSTLQPSVSDLAGHILESPIFAGRAPIIERGLHAYLSGDAIVAESLLIPQVENGLRMMVKLAGRSTYKPHRHLAGMMLKNFDDLLREEIVINTFGESVVHYLRVLFVDQRGWNLRNDVCHGITPVEGFNIVKVDRIFHALLILASVRAKPASG